MFSNGEKEAPLHAGLRTYTLHALSGANSRDLSIVREGSSSTLYTTSVAPTIDMHHPNSITLNTSSSRTIGAVRMYHGCDTLNLALGDPEDFAQRENCVWEDMHVKKHAMEKAPTHEFGLGLGDDSRRYFQWEMDQSPSQLNLVQPNPVQPSPVRSHSWSISEHVPGISRSHTFNFNSKASHKKAVAVTTVHELHVDRRCFKLVDRDDGEAVAILLRHEDIRDGALVDDNEDPSVMGKFIIFRDFWEPGLYQEDWDKMVLLSGLAVLERGDRE